MKLSKNRILANSGNHIVAITSSGQRPANDFRLLAQSRAGGGRLGISGNYTGAQDSLIDIEITSGTGGQLAARAHVEGVGSGTMDVHHIRAAAVPGLLRFTLADAGKSAICAQCSFYGANLVARVPGEAGNDIAITCTRNLTLAPSRFSLLTPIAAGETELTGDEFEWGQPSGDAHAVPVGALRIQFSGQNQVHRTWKSWRDGRFVYHLDPAPELPIPAGARILYVSGDYTLTVRQGAEQEVYSGCVTIFDFLRALQARSTLVEVQSAVVEDRAPGGMAVTDIPLITTAHARPAQNLPENVTIEIDRVAEDANTENIHIRALGNNRWSVAGAISGELGTAMIAEPFQAGPVSFTLFDRRSTSASRDDAASDARIRYKFNPASRDKNEPLPQVCMKPLLRGIAATDKTITFRYTKRPDKECSCADLPDLPVPAYLLGLTTTGGSSMLPPEGNRRRGALFGWLAQFNAGNLQLNGENIAVDAVDVDLAQKCLLPLNAALEQIYNQASDDAARDAALVVWDAAVEELKNDFAAYAAITRNDYGLWGEWEKGRQYVNTLNGHLYEVIQILADGDEIESLISLNIWPARGKPDWLTDGSEFTLTGSTNQQQYNNEATITVTLQHLGAPQSDTGADWAVGREFAHDIKGNDGRDDLTPARWRVAKITVDGAAVESVAGITITDQNYLSPGQWEIWNGAPITGTDAAGAPVVITITQIDALSANRYVVGREVHNSTGTDCWRVLAATVNGAAAGSVTASGLPSMFDPAWLKDAADPATPGEEFTLSNAVADNTFAVTFRDCGPVPTGAFSLRDYDRLGRYGSTVGSNTSATSTESSNSSKHTTTSESTSSSESSTENDGKPNIFGSGSTTPWYSTPYFVAT